MKRKLVVVLVDCVVDVVETVDVVVVPCELGHWPFTGSTSPCLRCALSAFRDTVISTHGFFFE